jgi:hypothetical protein
MTKAPTTIDATFTATITTEANSGWTHAEQDPS